MNHNRDENMLSDAEYMFIEEWLTNGYNQSKAYRTIHPEVNANSANVESSKLMKNPNIQAFIQERKKQIRENTNIEIGYIVQEIYNVIANAKSQARQDNHCILKALDQLSKLGGLYVQKTEITTKGEQPLFGPIIK